MRAHRTGLLSCLRLQGTTLLLVSMLVSLSRLVEAQAATFNSTSLNFPSQAVGTTSLAKSVRLTNTGTATLVVSAISVPSAPFADPLTGTSPCSLTSSFSLAPKAFCTVNVTFSPTSTLSFTGSIAFTDNAPGSPQIIHLSGAGVPQAVLSPNPLAFGLVGVGTTSPVETATLQNNLNAALAITSIAPSGDFAVSGNTCGASLAALSKCQISVTFTPTRLGVRTGTLTVVDSANSGPQTISLAGAGTLSSLISISVAPASPTIPLGSTQQFTATGTFPNNILLNLTNLVLWSSSATRVATISNALGSQGVATAKAVGTTTIRATSISKSGSTSLTVSKAPATVTLSNLTQTYDGTPKAATVTTVPAGLSVVVTYNGSTTPPINAGNYVVVATVNDPNYQGSATGTLTIQPAKATITLSNLSQVYTGNALTPSATTVPANLAITWTGAPDTNAGTYSVTATVNNPNYTGSASGSFAITKAAATVTLGNLTQTYTGAALTPAATTVPAGLAITWTGAPDTNAGTYPVTATVNDQNYTGSGTGSFTIGPTVPTVSVTGGPFPYDGNPHAVTATATGVGGVAVTGTFALTYNGSATTPTNAGSYSVSATFTSSNPNYSNASGTGSLTISGATPAVTVTGGTFPYDGNTHAATASATGVGGATVSGSFSFTYNGSATALSNAAIYTVVATFTSSNSNYSNGSGTGSLTISAATPTVTVTGGTFPYDGNTHAATAIATGVNSATVTGTFSFSYGGSTPSPTNAGSYSVTATFTSSDTNYSNATGSGSLTISPATPTIAVVGGTFTYDGNPHAATATATGVAGATVNGSFAFTYNGSGTAPSAAGTYTVAAMFTSSDSNYGNAAGNGTLTITSLTTGTLVSIAVTPANSAITIGGTQTYTATGTYSDNSTQDLTSTATWTSSSASVTMSGNVANNTSVGCPGLPITISATSGSITGSATLFVTNPGSFLCSANMTVPRNGHTATMLPNGLVLIAGGVGANGVVQSSAELYNPATGTSTSAGNMTTARTNHSAVLLQSGQVLIMGGQGANSSPLNSSELYDPIAGTFTPTATLNFARYNFTATLLGDGSGTVVVVGGIGSSSDLTSVEIFDPVAKVFTYTTDSTIARDSHTATPSPIPGITTGFLILGGFSNGVPTNVPEYYDPSCSCVYQPLDYHGFYWLMRSTRARHTATRLKNGNTAVIVAGGAVDASNTPTNTAEGFDTAVGYWFDQPSRATLDLPRFAHTATALTNNLVLVAGGDDFGGSPSVLNTADLYDPTADLFSVTQGLATARMNHTATLLSCNCAANGWVLIAGGADSSGHPLQSTELYQPASMAPSGLTSIQLSPAIQTLQLGQPVQFSASGMSGSTPFPLNAVTWTSSNSAVLEITSDSSNSGFAIPIGPGTVTVSGCAGAICGTTSVTVTPVVGDFSLSASPNPATEQQGVSSNSPVTLTVNPLNGFTNSVSLSIGPLPPGVTATVSPNPATSNATLKFFVTDTAALGNNAVTITGTTVNETHTLTVNLTITSGLNSISVTPSNAFIQVPPVVPEQFTATGTFLDGGTLDLTATAVWSSSNTSVATIASGGVATLATQVSNTTTITATDPATQIAGSTTFTVTDFAASQLATPPAPARGCMGMVFVPQDQAGNTNYTLVFGGCPSETGRLGDTWTYSQTNGWTQLNPATSPGIRSGLGMAYDASTHAVVLFGGTANAADLSDTWIWDGKTWTNVTPTISPAGRWWDTQGMAYDATHGNIVLFGGVNSNFTTYYGDTWTWDGTTKIWLQASPITSPSPRRASLAYDPASGNVVLFGGEGVINQQPPFGDTWTWDGQNWTKQLPANSPPPRNLAAMAFDNSTGNVTSQHLVLFGGTALSNPDFADLWSWDGSTWTQVYPYSPPLARYGFGMVFDPASGLIVYGGIQNHDTVFLGDLWILAP